MITTNEIRKTFLEFFQKRGHELVPSSSLVPRNDPTLMFTNAGMVQFKNVFTGQEKRPYVRATTAQKCVRAGGKHNDLDNVGYTARHHTFFEMMGNFSFGDYFKEEAISNAWDLISKEFGLPKDRLCVTVYSEDEEAWNLWKKIAGFSDEKIIKIPTTDNFWAMGDTGPCGPCSEIFYDHGEGIPGGAPGTAEQDGDRFVEIWNLVFMQYEQLANGERIRLPRPSIDTGSGLERLAAVMQGTYDNYETDGIKSLIEGAAETAGIGDIYGKDRVSLRVIADHLRSSCFLISDGVMPANEGRGYVLRRIMRRAMRHAHLMGCKDPLMWKLVPYLTDMMGDIYPELKRGESLIVETLRLEESRFKQTLDRGLKLLDTETKGFKEGDILSGEIAFKLYDTYGFPLDLTQDALRNRKILVDIEGFEASMARQREEAKKSWAGSGESATDAVWFSLRERIGSTEFLGYTTEVSEGQVSSLVRAGEEVDEGKAGEEIFIIVNQTPFYGESGGQKGDVGYIDNERVRIKVIDTLKKPGDIIVHVGIIERGEIRVGDTVNLTVDRDKRANIRANHSATHLLQAALRKILGDHVVQKGSLVTSESIRFDFSHSRQVSEEEIIGIEEEVNRNILKNLKVSTRFMSPSSAIKEGAMALFGEKYGEEVRVLTMGEGSDQVSIELCGGTHVDRTGDIGSFRIISEGSVASGIRRIEAVSGMSAIYYGRKQNEIIKDVSEELRVSASEIVTRIRGLQEERKQIEKELSDLRLKLASGFSGSNRGEIDKVGSFKFIGKIDKDILATEMKSVVDEMKKQIGSGVVALLSTSGDKLSIVVGVTKDLTDKVSAIDLVRIGSEAAGGKGGGGRIDMAQAGGPDTSRAKDALEKIRATLSLK